MKKAPIKAAEGRPEIDKVKRVYRAALDTIRKHDDIIKQKKAYRDVFLPEAISLRNRLKDYCERLMFYDPVEYGRKAEELLWRKVFYDIIQLIKNNRKQMQPSSSLESAFRTHLSAAAGYYHHLLFKLQYEIGVKLEGVADFQFVPEPKSHKKPHQPRKSEADTKVIEWAAKACHRCLVYLGDIARYEQDYEGSRKAIVAQRYYYQAVAYNPDIGQPHNQLGTLVGAKYYNVPAAYHYMRSLTCVEAFEGAQGNLSRLFEKNRKRYQEMTQSSPRDLPPDIQRPKDIRRFLVRFMHLLDVLHNSNTMESRELQECCQNTLQDFNLCMFYQRPPHLAHTHSSREIPQYLPEDIIFKIVAMCMMSVHNLQSSGSKQVTAAIAFSLALFSHVLNHVVIRLQASLYEAQNPRKLLEVDEDDTTPEMDGYANGHQNGDKEHGTEPEMSQGTRKLEKKRAKVQRLMKKRRRRRGSDSSEHSLDSDDSDEEDLDESGLVENDSEDELNYLNSDSDSGSSSESDDLMVSQELRPGFGITDQHSHVNLHVNNSNSINNMKRMYSDRMDSVDELDLSDHLQDFPVDLFASSSNFLHQHLQFAHLMRHRACNNELGDYDICKAVVHGTKEVSVPPGFDLDPEAAHVAEITHKLANFNIDTDTDTSVQVTDTENSSLPTESDTVTDTDDQSSTTGSVIDKAEQEEKKLHMLVEVISDEPTLPIIKVICDWMRCHPQIIATCAQSSQSLWSRLSVLLNFLPLEKELANIELCRNEDVLRIMEKASSRDWQQVQPLSVDVNLQNFPAVKEAHSTLTFNIRKRLHLTQIQEALICICCLRKFGYIVAKMKSINFTYDCDKQMFFGPLQMAAQLDEKTAQEKMADAEARRNQLMKDMAQLRLQDEVKRLEGSLQAADKPNLPPYLVLDALALSESTPLVKQLANSARFITIIPLAVIDHLDMMKKESQGAREAIRWLEAEFKKGNRYVRAQKSHEKTTSIPQKNLKKKDKDAWRFFQIIDCCKYLSQQSGFSDPKGMVCVLTNQDVKGLDASLRVRHAVGVAQEQGINVQNITDFHTAWKEAWKSNG